MVSPETAMSFFWRKTKERYRLKNVLFCTLSLKNSSLNRSSLNKTDFSWRESVCKNDNFKLFDKIVLGQKVRDSHLLVDKTDHPNPSPIFKLWSKELGFLKIIAENCKASGIPFAWLVTDCQNQNKEIYKHKEKGIFIGLPKIEDFWKCTQDVHSVAIVHGTAIGHFVDSYPRSILQLRMGELLMVPPSEQSLPETGVSVSIDKTVEDFSIIFLFDWFKNLFCLAVDFLPLWWSPAVESLSNWDLVPQEAALFVTLAGRASGQ